MEHGNVAVKCVGIMIDGYWRLGICLSESSLGRVLIVHDFSLGRAIESKLYAGYKNRVLMLLNRTKHGRWMHSCSQDVSSIEKWADVA